MRHTPLSLIYKVLFPLARLYWLIVPTKIYGVRCLIVRDGCLLMIRHTYGDRSWSLPGGAIKRAESLEAAAMREVQEEVGITLQEVRPLGEFAVKLGATLDTTYCFIGHASDSDFIIDRDEICEACWFAWNDLPKSQSLQAIKTLELCEKERG